MKKSGSNWIFAIAALLAGSSLAILSRPLAAADPEPADMPPEIAEAVRLLSSNDSKAADEAVAKLQTAMTQQTRQVIIAQQLLLRVQNNLAKQLHLLTGVSSSQAQAHVAALLEYNSSIYRWALNVSSLPDDQRDAVFAWGLKDQNLALVTKVFGHDQDAKVDAIHELAKQTASPAGDWMLQMLLQDKDREVSLLAMDALFDHPLSASLVDALCDKALPPLQPRQAQAQHVLNIHGHSVTFYDAPSQAGYNPQDAEIAVDLLLKDKNPHVGEKVDAYFWQLLIAVGGGGSPNMMNDGRLRQAISGNYAGSVAIGRLVEAYKPKNAVQLCVLVLQNNSADSNDPTITVNGLAEKYHNSIRVDAAALLLRATGQDPTTYGLSKVASNNNQWMVKGTAADENIMLHKVHAWLADHGKDFGVDTLGEFPDAPVPNSAGRGGPPPQGLP